MSLVFKSLSGLETIAPAQLATNQRITLITPSGMVNATWGTLSAAIAEPLMARLDVLENSGSTGPSIWPTARTISLTGAVTGSVAVDGSKNVSLATSIADGSLAQAKVTGLVTKLDELGTATNNRWGTGYTTGAYATSYGGNLDTLAGATFLFTQTGATNVPAALADGQFVILQNGPQNFGQQIGLRNGEAWVRGQNLGTWSGWNKLWTSANLDPSNLLLKTDVATAATKLANARTFSLTGLVTASAVSFDGSGNVALSTTMADNALTIAKTSGLSAALALKFDVKGLVPTNTPLNSVGATGVYGQNVTAQVTTANNYPVVGVAGVLKVIQQTGYIMQEYVTITNQHWRRIYDNNSWSAWTRIYGTVDFDHTTKYDKSGGAINGNASVVGTFAVSEAATAKNFVATLAYSNTRVFGLALPRPAGLTSGVTYGADYIGLATGVNSPVANHELKITDAGSLLFKDAAVYHAGNYDPSNPVPTGGVLNIGDPGSANLRFRKDGMYSLNGTTWSALSGVQDGTDPRFNTVSIGADTDIRFYEDAAGKLALRTGSSSQYYYFTFGADGNLALDGRVFIGGNEAWHAGNFNPTTKLNATATAVAATKLATARTINGVAFDGTANITITAQAALPDSPVFTGPARFNVDGTSTGQAWIRAYSTTGVTIDAVNENNSGYAPLNLQGTTVTINNQTAWHGGNFDPSLKANLAAPTFTGVTYFDVDNGSTAKFRVNFWGTDGINLDSVTHDASQFAPLNLRGTAVTINGNTPWTNATFNPAGKLDARAELAASCATPAGNNWDNANSNGWWMMSGGTNTPGGINDWFLGMVTVHNGDWIQQELQRFTVGNEVAGAKWRRWKKSGTWTVWTQDLIVGGGLSAARIASGWDAGMSGSISCDNWFRSSGATGIFFADFGGGWNMTDTTFIRAYNNKAVTAAWFEVNGPVHNPNVAATASAFRAFGNYGGGYGLVDGNNHITIYSESGHLCFGFGVGGVAKKAQLNNDGTFYATDYAINSDASLKTTIAPMGFKGRLEPVHFEWIATGQKDFGFIAQQVQLYYPEAVEMDQGTGTLRLKQGKLTAVLAAQVNEQSDVIDTVQLDLEEARRDIAELKELVAELRNR